MPPLRTAAESLEPATPHVTLADIRAAAARIQGAVIRTPTIRCDALSRATGAAIHLKLDNLQATGAFKERGAANRIALLSARERAAGVIAMSAGNHAQAVARHASLAGIGATIVMPRFTPSTKVTRTEGWGAKVVLHGETLAEAAAHAWDLAARERLTFIHPYDDPGVIAGQGTAALEMLEDFPQIETLAVPVGGGGLVTGCAAAVRELNPAATVYGVEVEGYPAMAQRLAGQPVSVGVSVVSTAMPAGSPVQRESHSPARNVGGAGRARRSITPSPCRSIPEASGLSTTVRARVWCTATTPSSCHNSSSPPSGRAAP